MFRFYETAALSFACIRLNIPCNYDEKNCDIFELPEVTQQNEVVRNVVVNFI